MHGAAKRTLDPPKRFRTISYRSDVAASFARRSCTLEWRTCTAQRVTALAQALEHPETRTEASEALRGLIDSIVLTPNQGELQIELKRNLPAMLGAAQNAKGRQRR